MVYYNEIDDFAASWLENLIDEGLIADGLVDRRSIVDVKKSDLRFFNQCHFFAGIGGWSYALRLAGWPDDKAVWTGSCPCQPFSVAGNMRGIDDERHLWPTWKFLIAQCSPPVVFGEQVASPLGREWLAGVRTDLETLEYAVAAADLCAASIGAPHARQRLYWVANSKRTRLQRRHEFSERRYGKRAPWQSGVAIQDRAGKLRRIESGTEPLVNGLSGRVGRIRAYGNAIVPQVAAEFIQAAQEATA